MIKNAPQYRKLAENLKESVFKGGLEYGDFMPTESSIATEYGVSRITVRKAFEILEEQKIVSPIKAKKRIVLYQKKKKKKYFTVPCFGVSSGFGPNDFFVSHGYDILYNYLAEEFQHNNINCPKVILSSKNITLPKLADSLEMDAALILTSLPLEYYKLINCIKIQNMYRYDADVDVTVMYNSLETTIKVIKELYESGKRKIALAYHDINFPFMDNIERGYLKGMDLIGESDSKRIFPIEYYPDSLAPYYEEINSMDAVILTGCSASPLLEKMRLAGYTPNESVVFMPIGAYDAETFSGPCNIKSYTIDYQKIARIICKLLCRILEGDKPDYDLKIRDWYNEPCG